MTSLDLDAFMEEPEPEREVMPGIVAPDSDRVRVSTSGFTLELSLRELLTTVDGQGRYIGYDPDADEDRYEPASLVDMLVAEAGDKLVKALRADLLKRLRDDAHEAIVGTITEVVRAQLEVGIHTNADHLGRPLGEPTPLIELIRTTATDALSKPIGDSYSRNRQTVLQKLVTEAVGAAFAKELQGEVDQARAAAKAAVRDQAAKVITETIERATRGL